MEVLRLRCQQIPEVVFLGVAQGSSTTYLAHAQQFVRILKGKMEETSSSRTFHVFLNSVLGKVLKEQDGGDLLSAIQKGSLDKMLYSFRLKPREGGAPSKFVTINGMKELLNGIPDVDATVRQKLDGLHQGFTASNFSFTQATPDQRAKEDAEEEEVVEEIFDNGGFHVSNAATCIPPERLWLETRLSYYQSVADKEIMEERLKVKDVEKAAAKEQSEKEKALRENEHLKEKAAMDAEKEYLKRELAIMQEREQARKEKEQAVMEERERTMREARAKDELEKKLAAMEERERARAKESETAAQLNAKEKELEWMKLQLEMEQRRKTMRPHVDVEDAGAPSDTSAPLQLVLTPFEDHIGSWTNAYRCNWFVLYSAHRAVTRADFNDLNFGNDNPVQMNQITSQQLEGGRWISLLTFVEKYMCSKVQDIVKGLYRKGSISGPVLTEVPFGATARFPIRALRSEALLRTAMDSPCKELVNGEWCCKVHAVVE